MTTKLTMSMSKTIRRQGLVLGDCPLPSCRLKGDKRNNIDATNNFNHRHDGHIEQEHLNQQIVIFNRNDGGMIFSQLTNSSTEHPL